MRHSTVPEEPVERRAEPRGVFAELTLVVDEPVAAVLRPEQASWRSFWVPGWRLPLASLVKGRIRWRDEQIPVRLRVVRVEDDGIAMTVVEVAEEGRVKLRAALGGVE